MEPDADWNEWEHDEWRIAEHAADLSDRHIKVLG
jgi:hypothetical protein